MKRRLLVVFALIGTLLQVNAASRLLNVDFGVVSGAPDPGPAAIGLSASDFWNIYDRDARAVVNGAGAYLKWSDGTVSTATISVGAEAWGAWGSGSANRMMHSYLYGSAGVSIDSAVNGLPAATYDIYFYAHGLPGAENGVVELVVGGVSQGEKSTTTESTWNTAAWQEGRQYMVFRDVIVSSGQTVALNVKPGSSGLSVLNGAQFLLKDGGGGVIISPTIITEQPVGGTASAGSGVTMHVGAQGEDLTYQWRLNDGALAGETNATLQIASFAAANVGRYTVKVSGTGGEVVSAGANWSLATVATTALLNVNYTAHLNPAFSTKVGPAAIGVNSDDIWNVYSRDTTSLYTWRSGGVVTDLLWSDGTSSGATLTVTNAEGAWLTLASDPMLVSYLYPLGKGGAIVSKLTGLPAQRYDVYVYAHGQPPGENSAIRVKLNGAPLDARSTSSAEGWDGPGWEEGRQYVVFRGVEVGAGTVLEVDSNLGVAGMAAMNGLQLEPAGAAVLQIATQPVSLTVSNGLSAEFAVEATGPGTLAYQWAHNGSAIAGATNTHYQISAVAGADAGSYAVRVSNGDSFAASQIATLTVIGGTATNGTGGGGGIISTNFPPPIPPGPPIFVYQPPLPLPVITQQPASGSLFGGETVNLSVTATNGPLTYQWKFNGAQLAGETNSTLQIANFSSTNVGTYTVSLSNTNGVTESGRADWALAGRIAGQLLNVNFTAHLNPAFSAKVGPAAIGVTGYDAWNVYSRDVLDLFDWRASGTVTNLSWADGTSSGATLTLTNAPGAWLTLCGDPMMKSYLYPFARQGQTIAPPPFGLGIGTNSYVPDANIYATLTDLPAQKYDIYVYAHGQPNEENAIVELKVNGVTVATKTNSVVSGWDDAAWVEGNQFVRFGRVDVPASATVQIISHPGASGLAVINGIQLAAQPSEPAPILAAALPRSSVSTVAARIPGPAQFSGAVSFAGGNPQLRLQGELGARYLIEASNDLETWQPIGVVTNLTGSIAVQDTEAGDAPARFYRATLL